MPKTYNAFVSIDADINVNIPNHLLTPEAVKELEDTMWALGSDPGSGLAELVASKILEELGASRVLENGVMTCFIEGVGEVVGIYEGSRIPTDKVSFVIHSATGDANIVEITKND